MSKLHRDNAGYVGCSYEETQDPYYSYNKLSLPLSESDKTVIREEQTFVVTQSNSKFVIDGVSQAPLNLVEGNVYTFDLSDSSVATHPFRIKKNPATSANSLTSGLPTGYSAITSSQYTGTVSNIETDDTNELYATNNHIDFDLGSVKVIHNFIAKFRSNADDSYSADYRIELHSGTAFDSTTLLAFSPTLESENTTDIKTIDHDFGGVSARYVRWKYTGGSRTSYLRYFYPYVDTSDVTLITSGTQGQSGATAKYVVPFGSGPLAYYCASHSGMGADIATSANPFIFDGALPILKTTDAFGKTLGSGNNEDPYAANLMLAIPMNGSNNGTTFTDVSNVIRGSGTAKSISRNGDPVTVTSESNFYGSSGYFDGNDYLELSATSDFELAGEDFTIELWIHPTSLSNELVPIATGGAGSPQQLFISSTGVIYLLYGASDQVQAPAGSIKLNVWQHIAVSRKDGLLQLFVNGVLKDSASNSTSDPLGNATVSIGRRGDGNHYLYGWMQDLRIYKGVAKYTSDFIPPDRINLLDLSGNSNNASNAGATWQTSVKKFYDGASGFLGGTNTSRVTIPSSNDFVLDGDFTIETWLYLDPAYSNTYRGIFQGSLQETGGISGVYHCSITSSTINFGVHASSGNASQAVVTTGAWHHIAIVRSGSNLTFWVNGSPAGSATETRTLTNNGNDFMIGQICDGSSTKQPLNGYLQDFRWYKGIAKYTSSFSPPERSVQGTARRYPSGVYVVS